MFVLTVDQNEILAVDVILLERPIFLDVAIEEKVEVLQYCTKRRLVCNPCACVVCGNWCSFRVDNDVKDGYHWVCQNHGPLSVRRGSWFHNA